MLQEEQTVTFQPIEFHVPPDDGGFQTFTKVEK